MRDLGAGLVLCVFSLGVLAQEPLPVVSVPDKDERPAMQGDRDVQVLEDIVVTATKREQYGRTIPASIHALTGEQLESTGATEMRDFLRQIPGVQLTELQPDLFRVSIRGIQADVSAVTPQTEGIFLHDIPLNDPFITQARPDIPLFDLAGVEVLKGPQGTLFGGTGLGGAVRYRMRDALPGTWELRSYGQYQAVADGSPNRMGGIAVNAPIGEAAALRIAGLGKLTGGTIDDLRNGEQDTDRTRTFSGRALLRWHPTGDWSIGALAHRQKTDGDDLPWAETTDGRFERQETFGKSPTTSAFEIYGIDLNHRLSWADVVSVTSYSRKESRFANAYGERVVGTEDTGPPIGLPTTADIDGFTQEVRLQSSAADEGDWQWLAGAYTQHYVSFFTQRTLADDDAGLLAESSLLDFTADVTADEWAVFGETSYDFDAAWKGTVGLRGYTIETQGTVYSSGPIILATGQPENRNDAEIKVKGLNPKLAVQYQLAPDLGTYLSATRGFRFGGIQIIGPSPAAPNVPPTYSPDSIWNYELGFRTRWLDGTLQADGAAFYIDWKDPQVQSTTGGAVALNVIDNADRARSRGGELAVRYAASRDLELSLAGSYTEAHITTPYTAPNGRTVSAGSRLPGYSNYQARGSLAYTGSWSGNTLTATLTHVVYGPGVSDILQTMRIYDYQTTDLRLTLDNREWRALPQLSAGIVNITDRRAVVSAFVISADNFATVYNRPRTVDVRLEYSF